MTARRRRGQPDGQPARFIVITGQSGAGKSQAIRALEDLGYYCVDNLPVALLPFMSEFARRRGPEHDRIAVVIDVRAADFISDFPRTFRALARGREAPPMLIFLEARHQELVRRFSETRRRHPLAADRPVAEGLADERAALQPIRRMADKVLDTTAMNVHELRRALQDMVAGRRQSQRLVLTLLSFGHHYGVPTEADLVFDVRFLRNPHWVPALRPHTGLDRSVAAYMRRQPLTGRLLRRLTAFLRFVLPHYVAEGKAYLTVAIGCTGGRHRSVFVAEALRRALGGVRGVSVEVRHRDVGREA